MKEQPQHIATHNRQVNILMLGGAKRVSMGKLFKQAGAEEGYDVNIFSYELSGEVPIALIGKAIIGKKWTDENILTDIDTAVRSHQINIILPFVDGAVEIARRYCDKNNTVWTPVGTAESANMMFDKIRADQQFKNCGIAVPQNYIWGQFKYPVIAKPRFGSASKGITILKNDNDLDKIKTPSDYLFQEYIDNREEITVDCYVTLAGQFICAIPRKRLDVVGGEVASTQTFKNEEVETAARDILEKLDLRGAVTIQFLRDLKNPRLMLMEINPRLGGGAVCSIMAGAPIPRFILADWQGHRLKECHSWQEGIKIVRYFSEAVFDKNGNILHQ